MVAVIKDVDAEVLVKDVVKKFLKILCRLVV